MIVIIWLSFTGFCSQLHSVGTLYEELMSRKACKLYGIFLWKFSASLLIVLCDGGCSTQVFLFNKTELK